MPFRELPQPLRHLLIGAALGVVYGIALRWVFGHTSDSLGVMTKSFIVFVPFAMGFLTVYTAENASRRSVWTWVFAPVLPVLASVFVTALVGWEGAICIVLLAPAAVFLATIGGVLGGLAARHLPGKGVVASVAVFPLLLSPLEQRSRLPLEERTVSNVVDVDAPAGIVWDRIAQVSPISRDELPPAWTHRIGFPRPIAATLSHEGVGGVRQATLSSRSGRPACACISRAATGCRRGSTGTRASGRTP